MVMHASLGLGWLSLPSGSGIRIEQRRHALVTCPSRDSVSSCYGAEPRAYDCTHAFDSCLRSPTSVGRDGVSMSRNPCKPLLTTLVI